MKATVLASGSKGNCTYLEGENTALIIDAGLSARETLTRLECAGGNPELIDGILVTHEHSDHISGLDTLARKLDVPVLATQGTLWEFESKRNPKSRSKEISMIPLKTGDIFEFAGFRIKPFSTYHDAIDPCGFKIVQNDSRFGFCTDTGQITEKMEAELFGCDAVVLESNHCPVMLENGPYPKFLKERIRDKKRGHLSNTAAGEFIKRSNGDIGEIILAHLSQENNTPEKALTSAKTSAGLSVDDILFEVSLQDKVCETIRI